MEKATQFTYLYIILIKTHLNKISEQRISNQIRLKNATHIFELKKENFFKMKYMLEKC